MRFKIYCSILLLVLFSACSRKHKIDKLTPLKTSKYLDITLEGRYWRSLYAPTNAFELTFTNNSNKAAECNILINNQYKHGLKGLKGKKNKLNKFIIFDTNTIEPGSSVTIPFTKESENLPLFKIKENIFFIPKIISLVSESDTLTWKFDTPLQESYF